MSRSPRSLAGVWPAGADLTSADGASSSGAGQPSAGASALRCPQACRKRKASTQEAPSPEAGSSAASSGEKGEDERGHDDLWRGRDEKRGSDAASASHEEPSAGGEIPAPDAAHSLQPFPAGPGLSCAISSLNPPADLLAVASAASSVAVDVENGRNDAPFEFRLTLATCTCSKVAAAVTEAAW